LLNLWIFAVSGVLGDFANKECFSLDQRVAKTGTLLRIGTESILLNGGGVLQAANIGNNPGCTKHDHQQN
jgi:hypothetical protein